MAKKNSKLKKTVKINPNLDEIEYLSKIIKHLEMCAEHNKGNSLEAYFRLMADRNRIKVKDLETLS